MNLLSTRSNLERVAAAALIVVSAAIAFFRNRGYGLVGTDTHALILASRVRSPGELLTALGEPMGGGYLAPIYYRPVLQLTVALDHAIGGLDPVVYQLTSVLISAGAAAALFLAAASLMRGAARPGALIALLLFLLHPVHAVVTPDLSRRPELLCVLFMSLAVAAQARAAQSAHRVPIAPAVFTAGALLSKETAFVLPGLCFVVAWVTAQRIPWRPRLLGAALAVLPLVGVVLMVSLLRLAILGDVLAPRPLRTQEIVVASASMLGAIATQFTSGAALLGKPAFPFAALLALAALASSIAAAHNSLREAVTRVATPAACVSLVWIGLCALAYAVAGALQPWYLLLPMAGLALLIGSTTGALVDLAREGRGAARVFAVVGLACVVAFAGDLARFSPLLREYPQWQTATDRAQRYLEYLAREIEQTPNGGVVQVRHPPVFTSSPAASNRLRGVYILASYSLEPWLKLRFPDRSILVVEDPLSVPRPDEVVVVVAAPGPGPRRR